MTVEPGFGGQKYIEYCTEKVVQVRKMIEEKGLNVDVQVDGGITLDNVKKVDSETFLREIAARL